MTGPDLDFRLDRLVFALIPASEPEPVAPWNATKFGRWTMAPGRSCMSYLLSLKRNDTGLQLRLYCWSGCPSRQSGYYSLRIICRHRVHRWNPGCVVDEGCGLARFAESHPL